MNITTFIRDDGACGYYRIRNPFNAWDKKDDSLNLKVIEQGSEGIFNKLDDADVVVIPRVSDEQFISLLLKLKENGKKIVIDLDDDMFNISPLSPHYEEFGIEDVTHVSEQGNLDMWTDGKNYNKKENQKRLNIMKDACSFADMVTVPQENLANVYREYNDNVKVLPNCVDLNLWNRLPMQSNDHVRVGWSGGASHFEDLSLIAESLVSLMSLYPKMKLVIAGQIFNGILKRLPQDRVETHGWCPTSAHPYRQATLDLDISLAPIVDNQFNICKSPIKWVESGALETPCVASHISPYKDVYDGVNGVFVDNATDSWIEGISTLIEDDKLRKRMGKFARKTVEKDFDINTQWTQWKNVYENIN